MADQIKLKAPEIYTPKSVGTGYSSLVGNSYYSRKDRARRMPQEKGIPRKLELRQRQYNTICRSLPITYNSNAYYIACAVTSNTCQGALEKNQGRAQALMGILQSETWAKNVPSSEFGRRDDTQKAVASYKIMFNSLPKCYLFFQCRQKLPPPNKVNFVS